MDTKHFHVLRGLRGCYLPDSNYVCETVQEAHDCVAEDIRRERDYQAELAAVDGETPIPVQVIVPGYLYYIDRYHQISISECTEPECMGDDS